MEKAKKRQVAIVHYNTPELTEAAILSLRKNGCVDCEVTVFDNSDRRPFTKKLRGVRVLDNTKGQLVDFDKELEKYPDKNPEQAVANGCVFGSAKHMMSVQWLMDNELREDFLLMDSDVLITNDLNVMFDPAQCTVGYIQTWLKSGNPAKIDRLIPVLLYINTALCEAGGARFFDPERSFGLMPGGIDNPANWYDTGGSFLEDIRTKKPACHGICLSRNVFVSLFVHFGSGSWQNNGLPQQLAWLERHRHFWLPYGHSMTNVADYFKQQPENENAKIYICTHKDFAPIVSNSVYDILDARDGGDANSSVPGCFYSELLVMDRLRKKRKLPEIVGFCGWRKYFDFFDRVPDLEKIVKEHGCLVSEKLKLGSTVREQWGTWGNPEDLDIATDAIKRKYKEFLPAWEQALNAKTMHPYSMFVMTQKDYRRLMKVVSGVVTEYLNAIGGDMAARIKAAPEKYHLPAAVNFSNLSKSEEAAFRYQMRVGGQLCERLVSAWIDWQMPDALSVPVKVIR